MLKETFGISEKLSGRLMAPRLEFTLDLSSHLRCRERVTVAGESALYDGVVLGAWLYARGYSEAKDCQAFVTAVPRDGVTLEEEGSAIPWTDEGESGIHGR